MGSELPDIPRAEFATRLRASVAGSLGGELCDLLHAHYQELRRWNRRLSLIGPGTRHEVVERHYGESLAVLEWVRPDDGVLVDIGSGAGFPGLVLAVARPHLRVVLVESRQRKWSFLKAAARRCAPTVRCLNVRVGAALPAEFPERVDIITARGVRLSPGELRELSGRLSPSGRLWRWVGKGSGEPGPGLVKSREQRLAGSASRRIVEFRWRAE